MKEEIILVGGGGHCKSCIDVIEQSGRYKIAGLVDTPDNLGKKMLGYEYVATDDDLPRLAKEYDCFLITLGQIKTAIRRVDLFEKLRSLGAHLPSITSPLAYVSRHSSIGEGSIVMHHALVNTGATIGANCIINSRALIEHDVIIGPHCHIATGAIVNGGTKVEEQTFLGSGSVCQNNIVLPSNTFIKANALAKGCG